MQSTEATTRPIGVDLFAGAGGLSLGFEQAGFDVAAAVEIDPIHCATHEYNFPHSKAICASVVDLSGADIRRIAGLGKADIDVVFGGAPCQGFSLIGKRALDDSRNQLVFHYVRLVRELNPKYFVFENVRGLTLGKHVRFLEELIEALASAGYKVLLPYQVLNAADFGVPQDRKRLFLIGARPDQTLPCYPKTSVLRATVWDAISDLPNADDFVQLENSDATSVRWSTRPAYARRLRCMDSDATDFSYAREFSKDLLTSSLRTIHTDLSKARFLATPPGENEPISRFKKLHPDGLCNTLRAGTDSARGAFTSPRPIHPTLPRVITVREAARLHSYPDWFRFHATKWHGFRQIGNSVPPLLGRAVAAQIMSALGPTPRKPKGSLQLGNASLLNFQMLDASRYFGVARNVIAQRQRSTTSRDVFTRSIEEAYV
ncbi:DNA cytosine methyltransferase [Acidovorax sp. Root217]|uniref:DNA cytosine methyltransferase n=1 Tax=Acidovorax sp. Root217 TaxID=1736492 RepID=UPI0009E9E03B|nr:DNA cytosine methyltransferase [Acidovorax sp. Root217]